MSSLSIRLLPARVRLAVSLLSTAATLAIINRADAQTNGVAVVGGYVDSNAVPHIEVNYFLFLERIQHPWNCFMTGAGGYVTNEGYASGMNWNPFVGPGVVTKAANPSYQYQLGMYLAPDLDSAYGAATRGFATIELLSAEANGHIYVDLRSGGEVLGAGPPTWITVSSGFSTSTNSVLLYGPQLEFIDAVRDSTDPKPSLAMSFCASPTAARYANLKYNRSNWNVFDLRQGLRQASTFY